MPQLPTWRLHTAAKQGLPAVHGFGWPCAVLLMPATQPACPPALTSTNSGCAKKSVKSAISASRSSSIAVIGVASSSASCRAASPSCSPKWAAQVRGKGARLPLGGLAAADPRCLRQRARTCSPPASPPREVRSPAHPDPAQW